MNIAVSSYVVNNMAVQKSVGVKILHFSLIKILASKLTLLLLFPSRLPL